MQSIYELRKNAPHHFGGRADNARFCAYYLYKGSEIENSNFKEDVHYGGTPSVGLHEGYLREAALALELALKASIAALGKKVPHTHNLEILWQLAEAAEIEELDIKRLANFRIILVWAGRYATPTKEEYYIRDKAERVSAGKLGAFTLEKMLSLDWEDFDRLYGYAIANYIDKACAS